MTETDLWLVLLGELVLLGVLVAILSVQIWQDVRRWLWRRHHLGFGFTFVHTRNRLEQGRKP